MIKTEEKKDGILQRYKVKISKRDMNKFPLKTADPDTTIDLRCYAGMEKSNSGEWVKYSDVIVLMRMRFFE